MPAQWRNTEFSAAETVVGHGRERVAKDITEFLNNNGIIPGNCTVSIQVVESNPLAALKAGTVYGTLFYYK